VVSLNLFHVLEYGTTCHLTVLSNVWRENPVIAGINQNHALQKIHGQISNQRLAFAHELSNTIAKATDIVVFEDLNLKGMQQWNGRMVGDNVMGLLPNLVRYKVKREGGIFHQIGRFEKSTGICSECGHHHKLTLKGRRFACIACKKN